MAEIATNGTANPTRTVEATALSGAGNGVADQDAMYFGLGRPEKAARRSKGAATKSPKAGALRGSTFILLHTFRAQLLVQGRPASGRNQIFGLMQFASYVRDIFWCAKQDDPYADWWLLKIEEAIAESESELKSLAEEVDALLRGNPNFRIEVARSEQPVRVDIQFSNPYAHRAADLVLRYDALVCAIQTAAHVGLLDRDARERLLQLGAKPVRRALLTAAGYRARGITRQDVRQWTARGIEAKDLMGELPEDVINGSKRSRLAPDILPPGRRAADDEPDLAQPKPRKARRGGVEH